MSADQVLIVGPGGGQKLSGHAAAVNPWLKSGGNLLLIGLDENELGESFPVKVRMKKAEYISAFFNAFSRDSLLVGIGPADVHNRDPRELPLVAGGVSIVGNGILGKAETTNVVLCQLVPWQFEYKNNRNLRKTFRRASFLIARLLANMGGSASTPVLSRFSKPVGFIPEKRWLTGMYLDSPEEWDDPYRFFRW